MTLDGEELISQPLLAITAEIVANLRENKAPLTTLRDGLIKSEAEVLGLARGTLASTTMGVEAPISTAATAGAVSWQRGRDAL